MAQRLLSAAANRARMVWWGKLKSATHLEKGPELLHGESIQSINAAGTGLIDLIGSAGNNPVLGAGDGLSFYDDFLGTALQETEIWSTVQVALNTAIAVVADAAGGQVALIFDADVNAEDAVLYWGDQRGIDVSKGAVIEFRARVSVLPTLTSQIVMGLAGDHNLDPDAMLESAWFKLDGDGVVVLETDDTTNNNDDKASGVTVLATEWHIYKIDFTDLTDVKFYIDGVRVGSATTFDMSNLAGAELILQPYFSMDKDADAGLGTLLLDYVKIYSGR